MTLRRASFASAFREYLGKSNLSRPAIADATGIPVETLHSWLKGRSKRPRNVKDIVGLARALALSKKEANHLLSCAGHPRIEKLSLMWSNTDDITLISPWLSPGDENINTDGNLLPIDYVPQVDSIPSFSRVPFPPNVHFVGRDEQFIEIAKVLNSGEMAVIGQVATITGIGGIGKTQLATEFVHRYGRFFSGGVFWLSFADPVQIPAEFAQCYGAVNIKEFHSYDETQRIELVRQAFREPIPRLLVFDNLDNEEAERLLHDWQPVTGGCRVILTSRRDKWGHGGNVSQIQLDTLTEDASCDLLMKLAPHLELRDATQIANQLGYFPLALYLAGSYLGYTGQNARTYQDLFVKLKLQHPSMRGERVGYSPTKHTLNVFSTFMVSWQQLDPTKLTDQIAQRTLLHAAYFAPGESIPNELLQSTIVQTSDAPNDTNNASFSFEHVIERLGELGFLARERQAVNVHRLVAEFAKDIALEDETVQDKVEQLVLQYAKQKNTEGKPLLFRAWTIHLQHITDAATARQSANAAPLSSVLEIHLGLDGKFHAALPYSRQALAIKQETLGPTHLETAECLFNLGFVLQALDKLDEAIVYLDEALSIRKTQLGLNHPDTAASFNSVGYVHLALNDLSKAEPFYRQALEAREAASNSDEGLAQSLNNYGYLMQRMGKLKDAKPYYERALSINERLKGKDHPDTAINLNNIGLLELNLEEYQSAKKYFRKALKVSQKVQGPAHPDTARCLFNLGNALNNLGERVESKRLCNEALEIYVQELGPQHSTTKHVEAYIQGLDVE